MLVGKSEHPGRMEVERRDHMEFLADLLIAYIESDMDDTPMRQQMVDNLMTFSDEGNDDPQTLGNYFDDLKATGDDLTQAEHDQVDQAVDLFHKVLGTDASDNYQDY